MGNDDAVLEACRTAYQILFNRFGHADAPYDPDMLSALSALRRGLEAVGELEPHKPLTQDEIDQIGRGEG